MTEKRYRPGEIARELDISTSSLRVWSDRFESHLDSGVKNRPLTQSGRPSMRLYSERDVAVLREVKAMLADRLNFAQIAERLTVLPAVQDPEPSTALEVLPKLADALTMFAQDQRERIDDLEARNDDLLARVEALERKARPWWAVWRR